MVANEEIGTLREKVALSCRMIGKLGVTKGTYGHVSARIPGTDRILIKAKGPKEAPLEHARASDIIMLDLAGDALETQDGLEAPQETIMHLALYRRRPDVSSVIHAHPDWIVVLSACGKPLLPLYAGYNSQSMKLLLDGIPVYPRSVTIVNSELSEEFVRVMGDRNACILQGHGITTAGRSVEECTRISMDLFELGRMNYLAYSIGNPTPVSEEDIGEYRRRWELGSAQKRTGAGKEGEPSYWRNFRLSIGE